MDFIKLGNYVDGLLAEKKPLCDDPRVANARLIMDASWKKLADYRNFLISNLDLDYSDAGFFAIALYWSTRKNEIEETLRYSEGSLVAILPALTDRREDYFSFKAFELSQRLAGWVKTDQRGRNDKHLVPLLCITMLTFVQRDLRRGKSAIRNVETLFAMQEAAALLKSSAGEWRLVSTICREILVELFASSSWQIFCESSATLFRSNHARTLLDTHVVVVWEAFMQADMIRRKAIIDQLQNSLEFPQLSIRGLWYHWRSRRFKRQLIFEMRRNLG